MIYDFKFSILKIIRNVNYIQHLYDEKVDFHFCIQMILNKSIDFEKSEVKNVIIEPTAIKNDMKIFLRYIKMNEINLRQVIMKINKIKNGAKRFMIIFYKLT